MERRIEATRVSDAVARELEQRILDGEFKPGDRLPAERQFAEILGVSKDTVLIYREKGLLPYRDIAPPGSTKPIYMYPLDAVVKMRTAYQTDQPAPRQQKEQPRRHVKGERRYTHLDLD